jgi:hypothetical protein
MPFNIVKINQHNILKAVTGQGFRNHPADASGTYNANPQSNEIGLTIFAPSRYCADLLVCRLWA